MADDITDIRRLFTKNGSKPYPVLVEFSSKITRDRILQSRKRLRSAPNHPDRPIYINENLTKRNAHIFALARKLFKDKKIHSTWTYNGYTYIKPDESTKPRRILVFSRMIFLRTIGLVRFTLVLALTRRL